MKKLICINCGSYEIEKSGGRYVCKHCGITYEDDRAGQFADEVRGIFGEELAAQKEEQIANCRRNLWKAAHAANVSAKEVLKWAGELKKILPDDFMADFYEAACGGDARRLNEFLDETDGASASIYIPVAADFLLRGMDYSTVLPLKNLIERGMKGDDYKKYMTLLEEEAGKIRDGVYSTQVPRDVFVAYSSKDFKAVNEIVEFLESNGITCFVALRNLRHGKGAAENYGKALKEAMHNCKCVVFLSSNNSRNLECDALKVELPYIRDNEPQMGRIEYLLEDYTGTGFAAKRICENFFKNLEYCREKEDLVDRILGYITGFGEEKAEKPAEDVKYCLSCGEKNPLKVKFCAECGSKEFAPTYEAYLRAKVEKEYEEKYRKRQEELEKSAAQKAEDDRRAAAPDPKTAEKSQKKSAKSEQKSEKKSAKAQKCSYDGLDPDELTDDVREKFEEAYAGDSYAQFEIGQCYELGMDLPEDSQKAVEWYKKASDAGEREAQFALAQMYGEGNGVRRDDKKAFEYYEKSAKLGFPEAQLFTALCYHNGQGVPQNMKRAVEWYTKAAEQGEDEAQYRLGICLMTGDGIAANERKAAEWFTKSADRGNDSAQVMLGDLYYLGRGVAQSPKKAFELYSKSAEGGNADGQWKLGMCYENGVGVRQSDKAAAEWYSKSAEQGQMYAQYSLGHYYLAGRGGLRQSPQTAVQLFINSAQQGHDGAQFTLGLCYENGIVVQQSEIDAVQWFAKAADQGNQEAIQKLNSPQYRKYFN